MNFFDYQDDARKRSRRLIFLFILAVIFTVLAVNGIVLWGMYFISSPTEEPGMSGLAVSMSDQPVFSKDTYYTVAGVVTLIVLSVIGLGSLYKIMELSHGGAAVAEMMGARRVEPGTSDPYERRLLNVVEEMSLASGVPTPPVYLMENESGINAFAAGFSQNDAIIAVTYGTLTLLSRDEIQAIIAHEFSHILNGDMSINLRMMGWIYGLLVLFLIGWFILRNLWRLGGSGEKKDLGVIFVLFFALGLMLIGCVGWFFGQIIKASVSRQREYLADASAVQFTRNPAALSSAFMKIGGLIKAEQSSQAIQAASAEEVSHMFIMSPAASYGSGLLATHPPLAARIKRLKPDFNGEWPTFNAEEEFLRQQRRVLGYSEADLARGEPEREGLKKVLTDIMGAGLVTGIDAISEKGMESNSASEKIVNPEKSSRETASHNGLTYAVSVLERMNERVKKAVSEPLSAQAVVYGVLLDRENGDVRAKQLEELNRHAEKTVFHELKQLYSILREMDPLLYVPLVEMAVPALKQMSRSQYDIFRKAVIELISADDRVEIKEYAIQALLFRTLDVFFHVRTQTRETISRITPEVDRDMSLVLSRLAWSGNNEKDEVIRAYGIAQKKLGITGPLLPKSECGLRVLNDALNRMDGMSGRLKQNFLNACQVVVSADGRIVESEIQLMHAVAAVLGIPVPLMPEGVIETDVPDGR